MFQGLCEPRPPTDAVCTLLELQVAEAAALVHALHGWSVVQTLVVPTKVPDSRLVFGKGNFQDLTGESPHPLRPDPVDGGAVRDRTPWWVPGTRVPPLWEDPPSSLRAGPELAGGRRVQEMSLTCPHVPASSYGSLSRSLTISA